MTPTAKKVVFGAYVAVLTILGAVMLFRVWPAVIPSAALEGGQPTGWWLTAGAVVTGVLQIALAWLPYRWLQTEDRAVQASVVGVKERRFNGALVVAVTLVLLIVVARAFEGLADLPSFQRVAATAIDVGVTVANGVVGAVAVLLIRRRRAISAATLFGVLMMVAAASVVAVTPGDAPARLELLTQIPCLEALLGSAIAPTVAWMYGGRT